MCRRYFRKNAFGAQIKKMYAFVKDSCSLVHEEKNRSAFGLYICDRMDYYLFIRVTRCTFLLFYTPGLIFSELRGVPYGEKMLINQVELFRF